jgi:hypothetical protein
VDEFGSVAEIDAWLRAQGFFEGGAEGLVADVYLGYGLSDWLRRTETPAPPEPCPLPRAAVEVRHAADSRTAVGAFRIGAWERSWTDAEYAARVRQIVVRLASHSAPCRSLARGSLHRSLAST